MNPRGRLATYSSAYPFLGALLQNGFRIYESIPFGRRRGGILASPEESNDLTPLREKDRMIALHSTAGVPYRDPEHTWDRAQILEDHAQRVAGLRAAGMPKWYKGS